MIRLFVLTLCLCATLPAQEMENYIFHLENGAQVLYQTFSQIPLSDKEKAFGTADASGNVIRRTMFDENRKPWIAFELHIDRRPGPGPAHFLLSMEPLGGWNFFGQRPAGREIANGDRILLDVLEEPGTGRKIYDTFQVGIGVPMQIMPLPHFVPQMPKPGTPMHIRNPQFMDGLQVFAQNEYGIDGPRLVLSVPGKGRFVFSTQSAPGFRMEAIADGKRLMFVVGDTMWDIHTASPVVEPSGSWYLWVRRESETQDLVSTPTLHLNVK